MTAAERERLQRARARGDVTEPVTKPAKAPVTKPADAAQQECEEMDAIQPALHDPSLSDADRALLRDRYQELARQHPLHVLHRIKTRITALTEHR